MFLIDSILLAPVKGVVWLAERLNEIAEKELSDTGRIKEELMELQLRFELDEITEKEYNEKEKELLDRLDAITELEER
jgi:hypothetical protein